MRLTVAMALLCGSLAGVAEAQQAESRWSPWLGCWTLTDEDVRVCVEPYQSGIRSTTTIANSDQPVLAQTLVADGTRQPLAEADCSGWQQAEWSKTGERVFARAELTCRSGGTRTVTGLSTILGDTWIDIQGIQVAGRENLRVRRYRRAGGGAASTARLTNVAPRLGATPFTVDDVKEASGKVSVAVLEAALVETRAGFTLSSDMLRDLDRAGVPDRVIDTMVAVSYPREFVVDRAPAPAPLGLITTDDTWYGSWPFPYFPSYYYYYGSAYSPYLYSPFGYGYWGSFNYTPYYTVIPASVVPVVSESSGGDGRAVNGLGYTRIRSRAEVEAESDRRPGSASGAQADPAGASRGTSSSSSGSSAGASPSGFSSGSSSGDSGRTAVPR